MKRTKSFFIALLAAFSVAGGYAQRVIVDGIAYMKVGSEAILHSIDVSESGGYEYLFWEELTIPESVEIGGVSCPVTQIYAKAFRPESSDGTITRPEMLVALYLPSTIKTINASAFDGLDGLEVVDFKGASVDVKNNAFLNCKSLTTIKNCVIKSVGNSSFSGCSSLKSIDLSNVKSIGDAAFSGAGLSSLELSSNVVSVGDEAFAATKLTEVSLNLNETTIGLGVFSGCAYLTKVSFGGNMTSVPKALFMDAEKLAAVTDWGNVSSIEEQAFMNTGLKNINIPASITSIGLSAFVGCEGLTANFITNPFVADGAFEQDAILNLRIDDGEHLSFDDTNINEFTTIIYTNRTFTSEKYASLMLPFVPAAEVLDQFEIYELGEMEDDCLYFNQVTTFVAGTPYLVKVKEGNDAVNELSAEDAVIANGGKHMSKKNSAGWQMKGVYDRVVLDGANSEAAGKRYYYYTSAQNAFLYSQGTLGVNPYRMYVEAPVTSSAKVRMMTRGLDGETTAIEMKEIEDLLTPAIDAYYDLNGCRVLNPVEGKMYIVNGKKIIF